MGLEVYCSHIFLLRNRFILSYCYQCWKLANLEPRQGLCRVTAGEYHNYCFPGILTRQVIQGLAQSIYGVACRFVCPQPVLISDRSTAIHLYRIAQEALSNVARHATATQATACLEIGAEHATLTVQDNGHGFSPEEARARTRDDEHFGLRSIHDRATLLGGDARISSQQGEGTTVFVQVPIKSDHL